MSEETRPMRADARRNRARVLEAAEVVLARDGLSASMRTVAEQAGVLTVLFDGPRPHH